jgi:acetyl esterase/lipase
MTLTTRHRAGAALLSVPALAALLMLLPSPTYPVWLLRFAAAELAAPLALLAVGAAALLWTGGARHERWAIPAVAACVAVLLWPTLATLRVARATAIRISLREYATGSAAGVPQRDVLLDPARADLPADVYPAAGPGPHAFVVVVHGGSWRGGDKGAAPWVSRALSAAGVVVFDVRYPLAPEHPFPAAVRDVKCLLGRIRERARDWDVDGSRGTLLGRSAGGEIALVAAYSAGDARLTPSCAVPDAGVARVVAVYAPTDLAWGHDHPLWPDIVNGPDSVERYLGGAPEDAPEAYRQATPQSWVRPRLPPTLLVHGTGDRMVSAEHAARLARVLRAAGDDVDVLLLPFADHGFDMRGGSIAEQIARARILAFVAGP